MLSLSVPLEGSGSGKSRLLWSTVFTIVLLISSAGVIQGVPPASASDNTRTNAAAAYLSLSKQCFDITGQVGITQVGKARSDARLKAINRFFVPLVQAPCLKFIESGIRINPYEFIDLSKLNSAKSGTREWTLLDGILYYLDFGFSPFTPSGTICGDGWISPSAGRGTCSWHGGYARPRGIPLDYLGMATIQDPRESETALSSFGIESASFQPDVLDSRVQGRRNQICVSGKNYGPHCFVYPAWNYLVCSTNPIGNVQFFQGGKWRNGWTFSGAKSTNCVTSHSYLVSVSGTTLQSARMKLSFGTNPKQPEFISYFLLSRK
jgi:hypothetical protein